MKTSPRLELRRSIVIGGALAVLVASSACSSDPSPAPASDGGAAHDASPPVDSSIADTATADVSLDDSPSSAETSVDAGPACGTPSTIATNSGVFDGTTSTSLTVQVTNNGLWTIAGTFDFGAGHTRIWAAVFTVAPSTGAFKLVKGDPAHADEATVYVRDVQGATAFFTADASVGCVVNVTVTGGKQTVSFHDDSVSVFGSDAGSKLAGATLVAP